jgi:hypothetical protein
MKAQNLVPGGPEWEAWADEFRAKSLGVSSDYLAGQGRLRNWKTTRLRLLGSLPAARLRYAGYRVDQLNSVRVVLLGVALGKLKFALLVSEPGHLLNGCKVLALYRKRSGEGTMRHRPKAGPERFR